MVANTIEDLILQKDQRGVGALRPFLPVDYCTYAAQYVLDHPGTTIITTGFYILNGASVETDGPPGALAIGRALEELGRRVVYVTDNHCLNIMKKLAGPNSEVVDFPLVSLEESKRFACDLLASLDLALLISIERCSPSKDGVYRNMRSMDISDQTAKIDALFDLYPHTLGIGDGGNEIGMGILQDKIPYCPGLPLEPAVVPCERLIIASISNWGGYGLVAALSKLVGRNLLPGVEEEADWVKQCVDLGAIDGISSAPSYTIDTFPLEDYGRILSELHELLGRDGV